MSDKQHLTARSKRCDASTLVRRRSNDDPSMSSPVRNPPVRGAYFSNSISCSAYLSNAHFVRDVPEKYVTSCVTKYCACPEVCSFLFRSVLYFTLPYLTLLYLTLLYSTLLTDVSSSTLSIACVFSDFKTPQLGSFSTAIWHDPDAIICQQQPT